MCPPSSRDGACEISVASASNMCSPTDGNKSGELNRQPVVPNSVRFPPCIREPSSRIRTDVGALDERTHLHNTVPSDAHSGDTSSSSSSDTSESESNTSSCDAAYDTGFIHIAQSSCRPQAEATEPNGTQSNNQRQHTVFRDRVVWEAQTPKCAVSSPARRKSQRLKRKCRKLCARVTMLMKELAERDKQLSISEAARHHLLDCVSVLQRRSASSVGRIAHGGNSPMVMPPSSRRLVSRSTAIGPQSRPVVVPMGDAQRYHAHEPHTGAPTPSSTAGWVHAAPPSGAMAPSSCARPVYCRDPRVGPKPPLNVMESGAAPHVVHPSRRVVTDSQNLHCDIRVDAWGVRRHSPPPNMIPVDSLPAAPRSRSWSAPPGGTRCPAVAVAHASNGRASMLDAPLPVASSDLRPRVPSSSALDQLMGKGPADKQTIGRARAEALRRAIPSSVGDALGVFTTRNPGRPRGTN